MYSEWKEKQLVAMRFKPRKVIPYSVFSTFRDHAEAIGMDAVQDHMLALLDLAESKRQSVDTGPEPEF